MCKVSVFDRDTHGDKVNTIGTFENKYNDSIETIAKFAVLIEIK